MAKQLNRTYVFTPGSAGNGTIQIPGKFDLSQLLIITNVTKNQIIYNFADLNYTGTSVQFTRGNSAAFPQTIQNSDGYTTIYLGVNTASMSPNDILQIFTERQDGAVVTRPWAMGTDAFERTRVASPQSMLDADFEYGLQPTKWMQIETERGYPSLYEIPGTDTMLSSITTDNSGGGDSTIESLITVTTVSPHYITVGSVVTIKGLETNVPGWSRAEGNFVVNSVPSTSSFTYYAKAKVGISNGQNLYTQYTVLRKGGFYTGASIGTPIFNLINSGTASVTATISVSFTQNHGLLPGGTIITIVTSTEATHALAQGPFYISSVPTPTSLTYSARNVGNINSTTIALNGLIYPRPDAFFIHRPFDGGVSLGCGGPSHGYQAVRQSKKYIRYQSGKAVNYNTGALFAPNYDLKSVTSNGKSTGSVITLVTDDLDHGLQVNATVKLDGILTDGYNGIYTVNTVTDERTFTINAIQALGDTTAKFATPAVISHQGWHGSTVRAGTYDDQNGMYWQYDGQLMSIGQRSSTFQLAGTANVTPDSNLVQGINTRFNEQLAAGDRIVIKGMTHVVSAVTSATWLYMTPDYRGVSASNSTKLVKVKDILVPQYQWNMDRCDGSGGPFNPSGYNLQPNKMQMIGLQWTWYGAGFIDWMLRGPTGEYITVHRIKNSNVNTEAYMRSGNMPVRYEIQNESARAAITGTDLSSVGTAMTLTDVTFFPSTGTVYVDNELIGYTAKSASSGTAQLTGLTRNATLSMFAGGTTRPFTAGPAAVHTTGTGVILLSATATPTISHWGSAFLTDGGFDQDRGYIFNYQATNIQATLVKTTAFAIRLAPSVSNSIPGDLGVRELINRAQLLLQAIEITAGSGGTNQAIVIEGVLNPSNYSTITNNIVWNSLQGSPTGGNPLGTGQPSFAQIAISSGIKFDNTATISTQINPNPVAPGASVVNIQSTSSIQIGDAIACNGVAGGTVVTAIGSGNVTVSTPVLGNINSGSNVVFYRNTYAQPGETIFSFISSPANKDSLDLSQLKEMTNTPLGGRGCYPNGPDVLAINVYITTGTALNTNLVLRWGEAQA
jgi:hypothetical protein